MEKNGGNPPPVGRKRSYLFIEIESNLRRKKLHRTNQSSTFFEAVVAINIMQESLSNLEEKVNPSILKDDFSSRTDPFIFTSIAPVLLHPSNETS